MVSNEMMIKENAGLQILLQGVGDVDFGEIAWKNEKGRNTAIEGEPGTTQ